MPTAPTRADQPRPTRASQAVKAKFEEGGHGAQKACSLRTKISQSRLSKIANGLVMPRATEGAALAREGILIEWWEQAPLSEKQMAKRGAA